MRRDLGIFAAYFAQFLKTRMAYRADFFAEVGATILGTAASLAFVLALFSRIDDLNGWHRDEILFIYGLSLVPYGIFAMVSWNLYEFGDHYIIEGNFDRVLLRRAHLGGIPVVVVGAPAQVEDRRQVLPLDHLLQIRRGLSRAIDISRIHHPEIPVEQGIPEDHDGGERQDQDDGQGRDEAPGPGPRPLDCDDLCQARESFPCLARLPARARRAPVSS